MKNFTYSFTEGDIQALLCTLSVFSSLELDEVSKVQQSINNACCLSAIEKLANRDMDFAPNEIKVMAASLMCADLILKNKFSVHDEIKSDITKHIFTVNKLLPIFSSVFD